MIYIVVLAVISVVLATPISAQELEALNCVDRPIQEAIDRCIKRIERGAFSEPAIWSAYESVAHAYLRLENDDQAIRYAALRFDGLKKYHETHPPDISSLSSAADARWRQILLRFPRAGLSYAKEQVGDFKEIKSLRMALQRAPVSLSIDFAKSALLDFLTAISIDFENHGARMKAANLYSRFCEDSDAKRYQESAIETARRRGDEEAAKNYSEKNLATCQEEFRGKL